MNDFEMVQAVPTITGITFVSTYYYYHYHNHNISVCLSDSR
jgi:hypothetical protein